MSATTSGNGNFHPMRQRSGLLTDLYELTMAAGYLQTGFEARATFELFVRNLPPRRNYLVAAGLEQCLGFLQKVSFTPQEIEFLRSHPVFRTIREDFFAYLRRFRFTGDVWAVPEGTLVFAGEPILRLTAPIIEAQIMETYLLATISFQTMIASKAARVVTAAQGRPVVEFGARRAHGPEASLLAARAAYIGGCDGTSNVLAGHSFGMSTYGTQAHSWIMAHEDEGEAFGHFLDAFPDHAVLLLDTYNVHAALEKILRMGRKPAGVRLDSGNMVKDSQWVRRALDRQGWKDVKIFASGDLDEKKISSLLKAGARIDAFGVGTALATPGDAPHLNLIYKLVEVERNGNVRGAAKLTQAKSTYPGRKQVYRHSKGGEFSYDQIVLESEPSPEGEPLLEKVMLEGKRLEKGGPLSDARDRCVSDLKRLPEGYRQLRRDVKYPVHYSAQLKALLEGLKKQLKVSRVNRARTS